MQLEDEMKQQVMKDEKDLNAKCVFLTYMKPRGKVDYIFVAMEPIIRHGVTFDEFEGLCKKGFINFIGDLYCATVHYCIWRALDLHDFTRYHITDVSKGAMFSGLAEKNRKVLFERWKQLLKKEIEILSVKDRTQVIAFGNKVSTAIKEIARETTGKDPLTIYHYSSINTWNRCFGNRITREGWDREFDALDKDKLKNEIVAFNIHKLLPVLPKEVRDLDELKGLKLIKRDFGNRSFEP